MLSKKQIKFINSLKKKKYRTAHKLFLAEGIKVVSELLVSDLILHKLYGTAEYAQSHPQADLEVVTDRELKSISDFSTPNQVLGIFEIPANQESLRSGLTVALDGVNDPGNLGTILRLCDWFDVKQLVCSDHTVDCYNQKVVQASMGSLARVRVVYTDLPRYLEKEDRIIYGTFLDGTNVYRTKLDREAVLVLGNEANGISREVQAHITHRLTIPQFGASHQTESLNVAMATAIFLSEFSR